MFTRYTLVLLIGLFAVSHAFADYYKYRDKDGVLRFTDNLGEVPAEQRLEMQRYRETKPEPQTSDKTHQNRRKEAPAQSGGQSKNPTQTEAQWLIQEQRDLDKVYRELMNEKMTLANDSQQIGTPEEAKKYRKNIENLNQRIAKFEKRRYNYQHRAGNLKDEIDKEKQRQSRPKNVARTPGE